MDIEWREPPPARSARAPAGREVCQCASCSEVFTTVLAFDAHRRDAQCVHPSTVGLERSEAGWRVL